MSDAVELNAASREHEEELIRDRKQSLEWNGGKVGKEEEETRETINQQ
jgi:hypothetical protein